MNQNHYFDNREWTKERIPIAGYFGQWRVHKDGAIEHISEYIIMGFQLDEPEYQLKDYWLEKIEQKGISTKDFNKALNLALESRKMMY